MSQIYPKSTAIKGERLLDFILPNPEEVHCFLHLRCNDNLPNVPSPKKQEFPLLRWADRDGYHQLTEGIVRYINAYKREMRNDPGIKVYCSYGSCRVVGLKNEGPHSNLEDYDAENLGLKAIQNICGFISKHPFEPFQLELYFHFSTIRKQPKAYEKYDTMVRTEIKAKICRKQHFLHQEYLPRVDRDQLTDPRILISILEERRQSLGVDPDHFHRTIIKQGASILFIACVFNNIEMDIIRHWIFDHKYNDKDLPTGTRAQPQCPTPNCDPHIISPSNLNMFFARTIECDGKRHELDDDEIMPILNIPPRRDTSHGRRTTAETVLGSGSYGTVKAVQIDPSYHDLTGDPNQTFALKKFRDINDSELFFHREFSMLVRLFHKKHPHLVTHITSWSQRDEHYILYPRARRNLRTHMKEYNPPGRTSLHISWLLAQFNGVASALRCIHEATELMPEVGQPEWVEYGYHHDIKPENILVFELVEDENPILKLSDFGAGRFHKMSKDDHNKPSQVSSNKHGTTSYYPPEYKKRSRKSDIWSLACVYFEIMIWFFLDKSHLKKFHDGRVEESLNTPGLELDYFWRSVSGGGREELRPIVTQYFQLLKKETAGIEEGMRGLLCTLLELISDCFRIDSEKRPRIDELCERLNVLKEDAEVRLERVSQELPEQALPSDEAIGENSETQDPHPRSPSRRPFTFPDNRPSSSSPR